MPHSFCVCNQFCISTLQIILFSIIFANYLVLIAVAATVIGSISQWHRGQGGVSQQIWRLVVVYAAALIGIAEELSSFCELLCSHCPINKFSPPRSLTANHLHEPIVVLSTEPSYYHIGVEAAIDHC